MHVIIASKEKQGEATKNRYIKEWHADMPNKDKIKLTANVDDALLFKDSVAALSVSNVIATCGLPYKFSVYAKEEAIVLMQESANAKPSLFDVVKHRSNTWGKDHWSLLAYIETTVVDAKGIYGDRIGKLNYMCMRIRNDRTLKQGIKSNGHFKPEYGSRLLGYFDSKPFDETLRVLNHDDIDCIGDMIDAGIVQSFDGQTFKLQLSNKGILIANALRLYLSKGGRNVLALFSRSDEFINA